MTIEQIRPAADLERLKHHLEQGVRAGFTSATWRHLRSDGSCIDVEIESQSVTYLGEAARLVAVRDVTGQINNLDRLNLALNAGKFAVWEFDLASGTLNWDPAHSGVYGIDRSLFPKNREEFLSLVLPEYRETVDEAFRQCVQEGRPYECEFQLTMPGKGLRWRHTVGKRIHDKAGTPIKILGIGWDITERKNLESKLHRSVKLEAVGRLASGIAHDFNNILTVISGYSHLLSGANEAMFVSDAAREIRIAVDRAARLVKQLLDFSRTVPVDPKPVELNSLIAGSVVLIRRLLPTSILFNLEVAPDSLEVFADPGQVEQLIMNLCLNARDAMPDGGTLELQLTKTGTFAKIVVSDTGAGIAPEVKEKMFEPFFTTKEVGAGSGLGLSIVHGIVIRLNGTVEVDSTPGKGSTFSVLLPLTIN